MDKEKILKRLEARKLIAVVRMRSSDDEVLKTCEALVAAGIEAVEITADVPGARELVAALAGIAGDRHLVGAGTVMDLDTASSMIAAGAQFIVTPVVIPEVIEAAVGAGVAVFPGALTPSEIWSAHRMGADAVKVFPASLVGPSYLRELSGPLPGLRLIPTGGINLENVARFIRAGAFAVGVGSALIDRQAAAEGDWEKVAAKAARFVREVEGALGGA